MTVNIEKMRSDMEQQHKWETRKFLMSTILATAAAIGAGVGIGNLIWGRQPPPQTPGQVLVLPPGTTITIPQAPAPTNSDR